MTETTDAIIGVLERHPDWTIRVDRINFDVGKEHAWRVAAEAMHDSNLLGSQEIFSETQRKLARFDLMSHTVNRVERLLEDQISEQGTK